MFNCYFTDYVPNGMLLNQNVFWFLHGQHVRRENGRVQIACLAASAVARYSASVELWAVTACVLLSQVIDVMECLTWQNAIIINLPQSRIVYNLHWS